MESRPRRFDEVLRDSRRTILGSSLRHIIKSSAPFLDLPYNTRQPQTRAPTTTTNNEQMSTGVATIAGRLVKKSQGLRERYREELERLEGPERYELAVEFAHLIQERSEQDMFMAQVQKEV